MMIRKTFLQGYQQGLDSMGIMGSIQNHQGIS
ncbi:Uncharacterised protein [Streptococcus pneumoniae]|nr:Uncharacterised protein [Streptococcus pneumoniae]